MSKVKGGPTAPVPKDPQPSVDRIDELSRRILTGEILLPKFQRGFVWDRKQVRKLWDSIANGYPIGGILLWQSRQELRSENKIADLNIDLPRPDYPVNYLLDGQQRLSSICGAIFWNEDNPDSIWNIVYDLRHSKFIHLDSLDEPPIHQIRLNKLSDPAEYFQRVALLAISKTRDAALLKSRADAFFRRFSNYKVAAVTLGDMSIEDVAPIFERINSTGTRLTIVDLMRAATWSPDFDLVDSIGDILTILGDKGYDTIEEKTILRNISAAAGGEFTRGSIDSLRNYDVATLKSAVSQTSRAYRQAVDYLATELRIPNSNVVPYQNQLVVMAEFFRLLPRPTAPQYRGLSTWFWKSAASGYFSGWNTGQMATDRRAVTAFAHGKTTNIAIPASIRPFTVWTSTAFRRNTAQTKLLAVILARHNPIDLLTGKQIDIDKALAWANNREFHHFFPRDYIKTHQPNRIRQVNTLANIVLLSSSSNKEFSNLAPSVYAKMIVKAAGPNLKAWLEANLISEHAWQSACRDDFIGFTQARARTLQATISQLT